MGQQKEDRRESVLDEPVVQQRGDVVETAVETVGPQHLPIELTHRGQLEGGRLGIVDDERRLFCKVIVEDFGVVGGADFTILSAHPSLRSPKSLTGRPPARRRRRPAAAVRRTARLARAVGEGQKGRALSQREEGSPVEGCSSSRADR
ncbi:hypothetical protein [Paractinoplanes toevensis]|uniref:hypothetical protein n=1 Tax=Paractinoplanes toevensis TaxID=571911 RepID=UPI001BB37173|nr:hypothetical protein [Actinoplanes toevensis]